MSRDEQDYGKGLGLHELTGNVWPLGTGARKEQLLLVNWAFGTCWGRDKSWLPDGYWNHWLKHGCRPRRRRVPVCHVEGFADLWHWIFPLALGPGTRGQSTLGLASGPGMPGTGREGAREDDWYKAQILEMKNKSKRRNQGRWGRKHAHTHPICGFTPGPSYKSRSSSPGRQPGGPAVRAFSLSVRQTWVQIPVLLFYLITVWHRQAPALSQLASLSVTWGWVEYLVHRVIAGLEWAHVCNMLSLVCLSCKAGIW